MPVSTIAIETPSPLFMARSAPIRLTPSGVIGPLVVPLPPVPVSGLFLRAIALTT